jgi:hypothetical protein
VKSTVAIEKQPASARNRSDDRGGKALRFRQSIQCIVATVALLLATHDGNAQTTAPAANAPPNPTAQDQAPGPIAAASPDPAARNSRRRVHTRCWIASPRGWNSGMTGRTSLFSIVGMRQRPGTSSQPYFSACSWRFVRRNRSEKWALASRQSGWPADERFPTARKPRGRRTF